MIDIKYKLEEIHPNVWLVTMDNSYDLAMTFCRVQEFYESPFKEIRGKHFNMTEFQRMYSMKFGDGAFTYPVDWAGFNVPSYIIEKCYKDYDCRDLNYNLYDEFFIDIWAEINASKKYYLIGSETKAQSTINHEVSHAFYYLHSSYKKAADKITSQLPEKLYNKFKKHLLGIGYSAKVIKDEVQAYLSADPENLTEINGTTERENKIINKLSQQLKDINDEYKNRKS